ncbi:hypothetical protein [Streptomyces sp. CB01580]|uniref:hypothetical protein n=2 Tax=unclassified Streptomyces TaxID=2593676 RepID=UPI0009391268|nr:hypothetical protein [Streptomyces sp. CB01580]OKJ43529.1 hypothetical protein AMK22_02485 [Streptomyces sp. CB01580]
MSAKNGASNQQEPPHTPTPAPNPIPTPAPGTVMVDLSQDRVGEFRGEWCGKWSLRPVGGGVEWTVDPEDVRPADPIQRLRAELTRANRRSRGELL